MGDFSLTNEVAQLIFGTLCPLGLAPILVILLAAAVASVNKIISESVE